MKTEQKKRETEKQFQSSTVRRVEERRKKDQDEGNTNSKKAKSRWEKR